jgi:hypothetical protein
MVFSFLIANLCGIVVEFIRWEVATLPAITRSAVVVKFYLGMLKILTDLFFGSRDFDDLS